MVLGYNWLRVSNLLGMSAF